MGVYSELSIDLEEQIFDPADLGELMLEEKEVSR